ncbi:MAG: FkbM family methyltransferase [Pseudomonadota bacterium]
MSGFRAASYAIQRFILRRQYLTRRLEHATFKVRTSDVVGRHIYKYGRHEPALTDWIQRNIRVEDHDVLIDVGANIGWYGVLFAQLCRGRDARVLCFEPEPENFALLTHNLEQNNADCVDALKLGVSDNADGSALHLFGDNNRGRHSVLPINDGERIDIQTARLDDLLATDGLKDYTPRLIKIDIEGFELMAMCGATNTLERCRTVIMEFSPHFMRAGGLEPADLLHLMRDAGFTAGLLEVGERKATQIERILADDKQQDIIWQRSI